MKDFKQSVFEHKKKKKNERFMYFIIFNLLSLKIIHKDIL